MYYLWSKSLNKSFEYLDKDEFEIAKLQYPDEIEITQEEAYIKLFEKISKSMEIKFSNYKNLDIGQECFYMLLKRYRLKGLFAPDKPWLDNLKMWWSFAKKSCLYIIRNYRNIVAESDIWDFDDNESAGSTLYIYDKYNIGESDAVCKDIKDTIKKLCKSNNSTEQQMGLFAVCKLSNLSNDQILKVLEIKIARLYEIRRALKEYFKLKFGNII